MSTKEDNFIAKLNDLNIIFEDTFNDIKKINSNTDQDLACKGEQLSIINTYLSQLQKMHDNFQHKYNTTTEVLNKDLQQVKANVNKIEQIINNTFDVKSNSKIRYADVVRSQIVQQSLKKMTSNIPMREILPGICIPVYNINNINDAHKYKGWLCWYTKTERYYISFMGMIFYGTLTNIITEDKPPYKYYEHKDCDRSDFTYSETTYYIPKEIVSESTDVRQFTNRMKFVPASKSVTRNQKYTYRLGSKDTLSKDIDHITKPDYRLFQDLTMNFFLTLIITKYIKCIAGH